MAIAFDAISGPTEGTGQLSWTHTPVGTPRGVLVFVVANAGGDEVTGVTYGGTSMVEVSGSPAQKTGGEPGQVYCFFLGSNVPSGQQTVVISVDATGTTKTARCITVTAATNVVVRDTDATINTNAASDPSATLSLGGLSCFCAE